MRTITVYRELGYDGCLKEEVNVEDTDILEEDADSITCYALFPDGHGNQVKLKAWLPKTPDKFLEIAKKNYLDELRELKEYYQRQVAEARRLKRESL